jgi:hypothetical protein
LREDCKYRTDGSGATSSTGSTRRAAAPPATRTSSHGRHTRSSSSPDEEDEDDENYHVVKEEAMEDVPPGVEYVPPEYQALVADGYDEETILLQAMEASKADEDEVCPGYNEAIKLTGLVANHLASLPPPSPHPPHARPFADYEGQEVPPPPGVSRRQRRRDHP